MDKGKVLSFAKALGLSAINASKRTGWVIARCPLARWRHEKGTDIDPSFGIRYGKRKTRCHCFSCDFSEDLDGLLLHLAILSKGNKVAAERIKAARVFLENEDKPSLKIGRDDDEGEEDQDDIVEWPEWIIASFHPAYTHPYLAKRDGGPVPEAVAKIMDFRLDAKRQRLGVPVRDFEGRLMGFHGRTVNNATPKYLAYKNPHYNRPIWLGEHWVDFSKPVLVVESVFDLARVLQVYRNAMCPLMASLPMSKVSRLSPALRVVLFMDADKAGDAAVKKIRSRLPDSQFWQPGLPAGYKDPGDMPVQVVAQRLKAYLPLDPILS